MSTILVAPKDATDIILLNHPRTGQPCQYLMTTSHQIHEIITLATPRPRSLLLADEIIGAAPIHVATRVDPVFFLISALNKPDVRERFVEAYDVSDLFHPRIWITVEPQLSKICDAMHPTAEDCFWRLSVEKTQAYLMQKISQVQSRLPTSILDKLPSAESVNEMARQKAAFELVTSYTSPDTTQSLLMRYDFSALSAHMALQKSEVVDPNEFIKRKVEGEDGTLAQVKKGKKASKGVEALKKVNTRGMRSMTSFFAKKEKPA